MTPQNNVDAFALWIVIGIFSIMIGYLIHYSLLSGWSEIFYFEKEEPAEITKELNGEENGVDL